MVAAKNPAKTAKVRIQIERYTPPALEIEADVFIRKMVEYFDRYDMVEFYNEVFDLEVEDDDEILVKYI